MPKQKAAKSASKDGHTRSQGRGIAALNGSAASENSAYGVPIPEGLHDAIESERDNLSKAESLLGCLVVAMEYDTDPIDRPYYPDVARMARQLVKQSINGLDSLVLQRILLRDKVKEELLLRFPPLCYAGRVSAATSYESIPLTSFR